MIAIDAKELWRQIPPEEKFELMATAHGRGLTVAVVAIIVLCTLAVGLHQPWLIWAAFIVSPLIFQIAAGNAWRRLRPRIMLEHLAARSAARRYAFTHRAKDLGLVTIIRAEIEEIFEDDRVESALSALEEATINNSQSQAWLALFNDTVIGMREEKGGAQLRLGHLINKKLSVSSNSPSGKEYSNDHELFIRYEDPLNRKRAFKITSRHPGALIVLEKKLQEILAQYIKRIDEDEAKYGADAEDPSKDLFEQLEQ